MDSFNMRAVFKKNGRAIYISHLDLMRTMQRAFCRSKIPVWYTQGYNPRIYLNFPLALSLGVSSCTEVIDFTVIENIPYDQIMDKLNLALPEGIKITSVGIPKYTNNDIGFAEYHINFYTSDVENAKNKLTDMISSKKIEVYKHSKKKGAILTDIKPHINNLCILSSKDCLSVMLTLPAGNSFNINSNIFIDAFISFSNLPFHKINAERTKILCNNGEIFV